MILCLYLGLTSLVHHPKTHDKEWIFFVNMWNIDDIGARVKLGTVQEKKAAEVVSYEA